MRCAYVCKCASMRTYEYVGAIGVGSLPFSLSPRPQRTLLIWLLWFGSIGLYSGAVIFAADIMGEEDGDDGGIECSFKFDQVSCHAK